MFSVKQAEFISLDNNGQVKIGLTGEGSNSVSGWRSKKPKLSLSLENLNKILMPSKK